MIEKFKVKVVHNGCGELAEKLSKAIGLCPLLESDGVYESVHLENGTMYTLGDPMQRQPFFSGIHVFEEYTPPFRFKMPEYNLGPIMPVMYQSRP